MDQPVLIALDFYIRNRFIYKGIKVKTRKKKKRVVTSKYMCRLFMYKKIFFEIQVWYAMHPFCCVPTINYNRESSPLPMPPPPPPVAASTEFTRSADSLNRSASGNYNHNWTSSNNSNHHHRHQSLTESSSSTPAVFTSLSRPPSMREAIQLTSAGDQVKINDIVGNGISGILHKWVNYGKGWRPRWFVLQDGVLSYYKIHGPDRIVVNSETEKGSKVIGEVSLRRISRNKTNATSNTSQPRRKPVGEVHLKVTLLISYLLNFFFFFETEWFTSFTDLNYKWLRVDLKLGSYMLRFLDRKEIFSLCFRLWLNMHLFMSLRHFP